MDLGQKSVFWFTDALSAGQLVEWRSSGVGATNLPEVARSLSNLSGRS